MVLTWHNWVSAECQLCYVCRRLVLHVVCPVFVLLTHSYVQRMLCKLGYSTKLVNSLQICFILYSCLQWVEMHSYVWCMLCKLGYSTKLVNSLQKCFALQTCLQSVEIIYTILVRFFRLLLDVYMCLHLSWSLAIFSIRNRLYYNHIDNLLLKQFVIKTSCYYLLTAFLMISKHILCKIKCDF